MKYPIQRRTLLAAPLAAALALLGACSAFSDGPSVLTSEADAPVGEFDHGHRLLDELLAKYALEEGVDYAGLERESERLDSYLAMLHSVTPERLEAWDRDQRMAFWINTYNAHILRLIVDNRPLDSIRDLGGALIDRVWDKELIPMAALHPDGDADPLSFNDVEHAILRPRFEDARIHAAINCASESCPPLLPEAFVAERLEAQLQAAMAAFVNDPARNILDRDAARLQLSSIFDWFEEDFVRDAGSVRAYVRSFAAGPGSEGDWIESAKIEYLDYSWALNAAPPEAAAAPAD